ncbi:PilZ domain-containing protein [Microvirga sp. TS319]|uniref:PilZ domain-containing protein n=1 Tax=Microvirga sp. TS319 TaxID=3241165 RepID=UPI003519FDCD
MSTITHEAEVQRQHPRYRLPMRCLHNGVPVPVIDLSVGGIGVKLGALDVKSGHIVDLVLAFPFDGYELTLPMRAEVRYASKEHGRVGMRFVDVSPRQSNLLRFVLNAYLSGEVVDAGDVLDVVARRNEGKTRDVPQRQQPAGLIASAAQFGRSMAGYGLIIAATVLLIGFIGTGIFQRLYIIPAQSAMITADLVTVPSPSSGQVTFIAAGREVQAGEPLLTIQGPQGTSSTVIDSPCDCFVQARYSRTSNFVREGAPVLVLRDKTSSPYITASIPQSDVLRFYRGAQAIVEYTDGTRVRDVPIEPIPTVPHEDATAEHFLVKLAPGRDLNDSAIGQPVSVVFDTFSGSRIRATTRKISSGLSWVKMRTASLLAEGMGRRNTTQVGQKPESYNGERVANLK